MTLDLDELDRLEKAANIEFKPIPDLPGYMAASDGHIWSFTNWRGKGPRALAGKEDDDGYLRIVTRIDGKSIRRAVHRLICTAFHGAQQSRQHQVRHLNGDKKDNRPANLAWGTAKDNADDRAAHGRTAAGERNGSAVLSDELAFACAAMLDAGVPPSLLAAHLAVDVGTVRRAAMRNTLPALIAAARERDRLREEMTNAKANYRRQWEARRVAEARVKVLEEALAYYGSSDDPAAAKRYWLCDEGGERLSTLWDMGVKARAALSPTQDKPAETVCPECRNRRLVWEGYAAGVDAYRYCSTCGTGKEDER